jgi:CubicO group peptidase (beta-lactamase class C family)
MRAMLVRRMPARVRPPGQLSAYSNYGTALAGYVVERASGEPYEQYVADHILRPLGMARSASVQPLPPALATDMSRGYRYANGGYESRDVEWIAAAPAAPVRATVTDMARFMIAHLENGRYEEARILGEDAAREMHRQQLSHDPRLAGLAYGFIVSHENDQDIIWHDGGTPRFVSGALGVVAPAVIAWRRRYWSPAWRVHYGLVAAAAVVLVDWLRFLQPAGRAVARADAPCWRCRARPRSQLGRGQPSPPARRRRVIPVVASPTRTSWASRAVTAR